jgi:hypothetical protein
MAASSPMSFFREGYPADGLRVFIFRPEGYQHCGEKESSGSAAARSNLSFRLKENK